MSVELIAPSEFDWSTGSGPAAEVRRITAAADAADGVVNLNEAASLHLKNRGLDAEGGATLFLAEQGFALFFDGTLDLVVHPDARRQGIGTELATAALRGCHRDVDAWSHSDHPGAARIAARFGLERTRELLVMERPLDESGPPIPPVQTPSDIEVRTFRSSDAESLLAVNASAFAHHPEQGHLTLQDFLARTSEDWFDPEGLFLAVPREGTEDPASLLGFHWTKVHSEEQPDGLYGEVYVVAVNPKAAGRGIGKVLTYVGLQHLRDLGLARVILYVDGDNSPAIAVYTAAGFTVARTEAQYQGLVAG